MIFTRMGKQEKQRFYPRPIQQAIQWARLWSRSCTRFRAGAFSRRCSTRKRSRFRPGNRNPTRTIGRYHMTIYANGVLGEQSAMAEFIRVGALQMAIIPCSVPEGKDFAIVGTPYLYDDIDHMERVTLNGVFDELFQDCRKYQFVPLTVYTAGERSVYCKKPVKSAEDLKGAIIRVNDFPTYIEMVRLMGGNGAVMAQADVYTALQQGVIDAAENSERVYCDFKRYEVAPYYIYQSHCTPRRGSGKHAIP